MNVKPQEVSSFEDEFVFSLRKAVKEDKENVAQVSLGIVEAVLTRPLPSAFGKCFVRRFRNRRAPAESNAILLCLKSYRILR